MLIEILPIISSVSVTPNDSVDIAHTRAILVGVAGDVKVTYTHLSGGADVEDTIYLQAGIWHPMFVRRVWSTGTTATGIHAGY